MATIQIRDIPDEVYEEYRRQARLAGQSLQAFMRQQIVDLVSDRVRKAAAIARLEEFLERDGGVGMTPEQIVAELEADRR